MILSERKRRIKILLSFYLILLIIEGAFRKWFAPFLSTPLLLARDPFATLALFWAIPLLQNSIYWIRVQYLLYLGTISLPLTLYFGQWRLVYCALWFKNILDTFAAYFCIPIGVYSPRCHEGFMVNNSFNYPYGFINTAQSTTPPSHILNIGPGGSGSSAFAGAAGKFRPSGVFSFTNSVGLFLHLALLP